MAQRRRIVLKIGQIKPKVEDELNNKSEFQQAYIESFLKEEAYPKGMNDTSNSKYPFKNNQNAKQPSNSNYCAGVQDYRSQIDESTNINTEFFQCSGQGFNSDQHQPNQKTQQHIFKRIQCVSDKEKSEIQRFILTKKQQQQKLVRNAEGYILEMSQAQITRQKILNSMLQANKSSKNCSLIVSPEKTKTYEESEEITEKQSNHQSLLNNSAVKNKQEGNTQVFDTSNGGGNTAGTTTSNFEALFPLKSSASSDKHTRDNNIINTRRRICSSNGRRDWNERKYIQLLPAQRGQQVSEQGAQQFKTYFHPQNQSSINDQKDMSETIIEGTPIRQRCLFKHPALATAVQQKNRSVSSNSCQQRAALKQQRFHISFNEFFQKTKDDKSQQQQQQQQQQQLQQQTHIENNINLHGNSTQYCKSHSSQLLQQAPIQEQPRTPSKLSHTTGLIINSEQNKRCIQKIEQQQQQQLFQHPNCHKPNPIAAQEESSKNDSLTATNWMTEVLEPSSMQNQKQLKSQQNNSQQQEKLDQHQHISKVKSIEKNNLNTSNSNHLQTPQKHRAITECVRIQTEPSYSSSIEYNDISPKRLLHRPFSGKHSSLFITENQNQQLKHQIFGNSRRTQIDQLLSYFNSVAVFANPSQQPNQIIEQELQQTAPSMLNKGNDNKEKISSSQINRSCSNNLTDKQQQQNFSTIAPVFHKPNLTLGTFEISNNNNSLQQPLSSQSVRSRALPITPNKLATMSMLCQKPQQTNLEQKTQDKLKNLAQTADTATTTLQRSVLSLLSCGSMGQISSVSSSSNGSQLNIAPKYNQTCKTPTAKTESIWKQTEESKHNKDCKEQQQILKKPEDMNISNSLSAKPKKQPKKRSMTAINGRKIHKFTDKNNNSSDNHDMNGSIDSPELFVKRSRRLIEKSGKDPDNFSTLAITLDSISLPQQSQQSNQNMSHSPLFLHKSFVLPK